MTKELSPFQCFIWYLQDFFAITFMRRAMYWSNFFASGISLFLTAAQTWVMASVAIHHSCLNVFLLFHNQKNQWISMQPLSSMVNFSFQYFIHQYDHTIDKVWNGKQHESQNQNNWIRSTRLSEGLHFTFNSEICFLLANDISLQECGNSSQSA